MTMKPERLPIALWQMPRRLLSLVFIWLVVVRVVRWLYKFPMPQFMAPVIDNPLRRRIQPPDGLALRHGLKPGMTVLEVGPGSGTYTMAAARQVGPLGKVISIDIEPKMIERVTKRVSAEGVQNVEAQLANVYELPFDTGSFDAIYMVTVIGEIPEPGRAMREFCRVLKPSGTLAFSELLFDPDYPMPRTLTNLAQAAGFQLRQKSGNLLAYTVLFEKVV